MPCKECYNLIATVAVLSLSLSLLLQPTNLIFLQHFAESFRCGSETETARWPTGGRKSLSQVHLTLITDFAVAPKSCVNTATATAAAATAVGCATFLQLLLLLPNSCVQPHLWLLWRLSIKGLSGLWQLHHEGGSPLHSRQHAPRVTSIAKAFEQHDATGNLQLATDNWQQQ